MTQEDVKTNNEEAATMSDEELDEIFNLKKEEEISNQELNEVDDTQKIKVANVQDLFDRNETFKLKGLQLSDDDLFQRLNLQDEMITISSNLRSQYLEKKLELDRDKALRTLELKQEKDENGKGYTEKWIEALIKKEFFDKDLNLTVTKTTFELLMQKAGTITEYINIVKMNRKAAFTM